MAVIVRGFQYYDLTNPVEAWSPGAAAFLGGQTLAGWGLPPTGDGIGIRTAFAIGLSNITLSGGTALYNMSVAQSLPTVDNVRTDTTSQSISTLIYNPVFIGKITEGGSIAICMYVKPDNNPTPEICFYLSAKKYEQTPDGAAQSARVTWNYSNYAGSDPEYQRTGIENPDFAQYPLIKMYRTTIEEKEFYIVAVGVNAANQPVISSGMYFGTVFYAIPCVWFEDRLPIPWAGEESKDNSEESYLPEAPYTDSISTRDLTGKRNPYGFNSGNGLKLAVIDFQKYGLILQGIYSGTSTGFLNRIAQNLSWIAGGNDHRSAEEIQAMTNAILACHMLPNIVSYTGTSGSIRTISGYQLFGQDLSGVIAGLVMQVTLTSYTIYEFTSGYIRINPRLNSFLDFEPYSSITLHLPFMNSVQLQPSAVYGNEIKIDYKLDLYSGILSADIIIRENNNIKGFTREYIVCTQQANIKTDIPVIGSGANGNNLSQIASSVIGSTTKAGKVAGLAGAIVGGTAAATDALSSITTGVVIGEENLDGIGAYLSSRTAYLIIARPEPAVPSGYFHLQGSTRHGGGKVGDYTGYAEFEAVDLSGFHATEAEKSAIDALLKEGVYL